MTVRERTMTTRITTAGLLLVALAAAPAAAQSGRRQREVRNVTVEPGDQITISTERVRQYSPSNDRIRVQLTDAQDQFVVTAVRPGQSNLLLLMEDLSEVQYRITIPGDPCADDPNCVRVDERENIRLDLYFVRLLDSYSHSVGVGWPSSIGDGSTFTTDVSILRQEEPMTDLAITRSTNIQFGLTSVLPRIDLSQARGWTRLYRQVALITANGETSRFNAGGEINVPISGSTSAGVQTIPYGTVLECTPTFDPESGRIELRINAQISDLGPDAGTGIPSRNLSEVQTVVNLELGQSIVLGGFISANSTRDRSGLPGLSQIPILGALFGIHSGSREESEALMFIVPSVVDAVPIEDRNRIQEALRIYDRFSGGVQDTDLFEQPDFAEAIDVVRPGESLDNEDPDEDE